MKYIHAAWVGLILGLAVLVLISRTEPPCKCDEAALIHSGYMRCVEDTRAAPAAALDKSFEDLFKTLNDFSQTLTEIEKALDAQDAEMRELNRK